MSKRRHSFESLIEDTFVCPCCNKRKRNSKKAKIKNRVVRCKTCFSRAAAARKEGIKAHNLALIAMACEAR